MCLNTSLSTSTLICYISLFFLYVVDARQRGVLFRAYAYTES